MTRTVEAPRALRVETSPRWVRGYVKGKLIVDSKRVHVVYGERRTPLYYFPRADVRMDLLDESRTDNGVQYWTLRLGDHRVDDIAWSHAVDSAEFEPLRDLIALEWRKVESWYEEDDEVFVHPRDPYHRVDVLNSSRHVKVVIDGQVVAETSRPRLLFETGIVTRYYIPKVDVRLELLVPSNRTTQCPYKGTAQYYSVKLGDKLYEDVIWYYPFPIAECPKIANLLAFYNEKVDLYVDGELQGRPAARRDS
jgi:uncharacterized protein (DUF427 family)